MSQLLDETDRITGKISRECLVYLIPEEEGGYSVISADLPGVGSQGESIEEALINVEEAFEGVIESYRDAKQEIPWLESPDVPEPDYIQKTVTIDV